MAILGILLLAAAAVTAGALVAQDHAQVHIRVFHLNATVDQWGLALFGAIVIVVALVGCVLIVQGIRRQRRISRERRELLAERDRAGLAAPSVPGWLDEPSEQVYDGAPPPSEDADEPAHAGWLIHRHARGSVAGSR